MTNKPDNLSIREQQSKNLSLESWNALTQHICEKALEKEDYKSLIFVLRLNHEKAIEDRRREESRGSYKIAKQVIMLAGATILIALGSNIGLTYLGKSNDSLNTTSQIVITSIIGLTTTTVTFVVGKNSNKQKK